MRVKKAVASAPSADELEALTPEDRALLDRKHKKFPLYTQWDYFVEVWDEGHGMDSNQLNMERILSLGRNEESRTDLGPRQQPLAAAAVGAADRYVTAQISVHGRGLKVRYTQYY